MKTKCTYMRPVVLDFSKEVKVMGVPGAVWGAVLMVARAVAAAVAAGAANNLITPIHQSEQPNNLTKKGDLDDISRK